MDPTAIIEHLKKLFGTQSRTARYQLSKALFGSKLTGNSPVGPYVNRMIDLIEELEKLGCKLGKELSQDLILQSLSESFSQFMLNKLIDYENQLASEKKKRIVMFVGNSSKKKGKSKIKPKKKPIAPKGGVTKPKGKRGKADQSDAECFYCKKIGHWKRNCLEYLTTLNDKKQGVPNK
ncbi:uncharacterized protein [Nicotiana sylvestris]|uniref:uncharacterized protein n=1 Tax=Nicotiana sylvestris TaxID=4096 RepID=UPI00388C797E